MQNINKDTIQGSWRELKGKMMQSWSKLTDDDFKGFQGNIEELKGKIQKLYGYSKEQIETEFQKFGERNAKRLKDGTATINDKLDETFAKKDEDKRNDRL